MLVTPPKRSLAFFATALICAACSLTAFPLWGQQTPSQRYQPVRQSAYQAQTPARNTPIANAKRIPPANFLQSNSSTAPAPAPSIPNQDAYYPEGVRRGLIQQTSHQEPFVPEVSAQPAPRQTAPIQPMAKQTPEDFANSFGQDPTRIGSPTANSISQKMEQLRQLEAERRRVAQSNSSTIPVNAAPQVSPSPAPAMEMPKVSSAFVQPESSVNQQRREATEAAANRISAQNQMATQAAAQTPIGGSSNVSATQFLSQSQIDPQEKQFAPRVVAPTQAADSPAMQMMQKPVAGGMPAPLRDNNVAPANRNVDVKQAELALAAPAISVITQGPETIGINKPCKYRVTVKNNSVITADRILVGLNFPTWVEVENVTLTSGGKEITDGKNQARLVWSVDQVAGNSEQTLEITAIPRKAEVFDLGLEWTLVPRVGKTNIRVTEPKLAMSISGPKEVLYGETALYHVAVRNPGTGDAEAVTVMLPESLGGERQWLGVIPAGKEKNFQVELIARTAGDLNLQVSATGDNNLTTSSERSLIVRRGKLDVAMQGPRLRYAGDTGKYTVTVKNTGDATATEMVAVVALPPGVKYLSGIDGVKLIRGGMRWPVGSLDPQQSKTYTMHCQLNTSGDLQLEVGTQGKGGLKAAGAWVTTVETIADLVLSVSDLKGPLPTGELVPYTITIRNRGTKAAKDISLVMQFSKGVNPKSAKGLQHQITESGQVKFAPIQQIDPGQEIKLEVSAMAYVSGNHVFRAHLNSDVSEAHEIAEGTTRFYGDSVQPPAASTAEKAKSLNSFQK